MGLSFAIPIDVAMDVADQLRDGGKVSRGRIGVMIQEVTADLADSFGLKSPRGALVANVEPGSPAEQAGLQVSDIILKFNGKAVHNSIELPRLVGATKPGTQARLTVWRKGKEHEMDIRIGEMSEDKAVVAKAPEARKANRAGLVVSELTREQKGILKIGGGVLVEEASGSAARAGIQSGDIILAVNNQEVDSPEDLNRLIEDSARKSVALLIKRGDGAHYVSLRLDR